MADVINMPNRKDAVKKLSRSGKRNQAFQLLIRDPRVLLPEWRNRRIIRVFHPEGKNRMDAEDLIELAEGSHVSITGKPGKWYGYQITGDGTVDWLFLFGEDISTHSKDAINSLVALLQTVACFMEDGTKPPDRVVVASPNVSGPDTLLVSLPPPGVILLPGDPSARSVPVKFLSWSRISEKTPVDSEKS